MNGRMMIAPIAGAALILSAPLFAQARGGGHGLGGVAAGSGLRAGTGAQVGAGMHQGVGIGNNQATRIGTGVRAGTRAGEHVRSGPVRSDVDMRATTRANARVKSQGAVHASDRALLRASERSVLRDGVVVSGPLTGLRTGLVVRDSAGVRIGTVTRVNRTREGNVAAVLVATDDGRRRVVSLAPATLTIAGDIVTTTEAGLAVRER